MRCSTWSWILIGAVSLSFSGGCANNTETGALVGGGGGAVAGGLIGSMSHSRAGEGALIGAAAGAIGGALIGHAMDESDKKKDQAAYAADNPQEYSHADHYSGGTITEADVINWTSCGTRDGVIIDRIERSGTVFHLAYADEQDLRDAGVSEVVIQEMKATARR
jgi:uncharacterized membrane protein YebE (DUF533 family)